MSAGNEAREKVGVSGVYWARLLKLVQVVELYHINWLNCSASPKKTRRKSSPTTKCELFFS